MSFTNDIEKFVKKTGANADKVMRNVVLDIGKSLVMKTPVGDPKYWKSKPPKGYAGGHARANWNHSMDVRVNQIVNGIDKSGSATIARISGSIPKKAAGHIHYIQNCVPYIKRLEEGHSRQAPHGMVALTEIEFKDYMSKALAALK
jgi:hypothetical protein